MNTQSKKPKLQGKNTAHRNALEKSLLLELIRNERLQSTPRKVKFLKASFDKLVTRAKKDTDASRRFVEGYLNNYKAVTKFYNKILPRLADVSSGYTHTARTLPRKGDNAEQMVIVVKGLEYKGKASALQSAMKQKQEDNEKSIVNKVKKTVTGDNK